MNTIGPVVAAALVALQLLAALLRVEAWPLSAYEMYSHDWDPSTVVTHRVRLVGADGGNSWWQPRLRKDQHAFSIQFGFILHSTTDANEFGRRVRALIERTVVAELTAAGAPAPDWRRIEVVGRRVTGSGRASTVQETLVYAVSVERERTVDRHG